MISPLGLFLLCTFLGFACTKPSEPRNEKVYTANKVANDCAKKLRKKYGFEGSGCGGGMMNEVEALCLAFYIHRQLTKEEAREILIDCAHQLISDVNTNEAIQKYLIPGGFTKKNVQIQIFIYPDHKKPYYPDLGVCSFNFGKLDYDTHDPDKIGYRTTEVESYEEAVALLENSNQG